MSSSDAVRPTYPLKDGFSMPAEWSAHARTWMCWPCRLEAWGSTEAMQRAKRAYAAVARAISSLEPLTMAARPQDVAEVRAVCGNQIDVFATPLDDSWSRDIGPTFLTRSDGVSGAIQWRFNAWGEKYPQYAEDAQFARHVAERSQTRLFHAPFVCEGGAIHTDGEGTFLTTEQTLLNPNRNPRLNRSGAETFLAHYVGAKNVIWLGEGFSDEETDGHVDNIACFAGQRKVLIGVPANHSHPDSLPVKEAINRLRNARNAKGEALEVIEIPQPERQRCDGRGRLLQASYINFYICNDGIVMPRFEDRNDETARSILADIFSFRKIIQIDALDIVQGGGGIHCITQQEPA